MNADNIFSVLSSIVTVALVTTVVSRPTSADIIRALGDAFSNAIAAAQGRA